MQRKKNENLKRKTSTNHSKNNSMKKSDKKSPSIPTSLEKTWKNTSYRPTITKLKKTNNTYAKSTVRQSPSTKTTLRNTSNLCSVFPSGNSQDNLKRNVSQDCIYPKSKRSKIKKSGQEDSFEKESQTINNTNRSLPSQCRKEESAENSFALNNEVETPRSTQEESTNMYSLDFGYSVIFSYTSSRDNQEQDPSPPSARENSLSNQEEQNDIDKIIQSRTTVTTPDHSVDYLIAQQYDTNLPEYSNKRKSMESPIPSPKKSYYTIHDNNLPDDKRLFDNQPEDYRPEYVFNPDGDRKNLWE